MSHDICVQIASAALVTDIMYVYLTVKVRSKEIKK